MKYRNTIPWLWAAILLHGCIIDTVPLPDFGKDDTPDKFDPTPGYGAAINESGLFYTGDPVLLVGVERAVPAGVDVVAANPSRQNWRGTTESTASGSFNMPLNATVGDLIEVTIYIDGYEADATFLLLEPASSEANRANEDLDAFLASDGGSGSEPPDPAGAVVVSPPSSQNIVTISAPAGTVQAGIAVVVANISNGASTVALAQNDGSFLARLAGQSGHELSIFAVDPTASNAGSTPLTAFVP